MQTRQESGATRWSRPVARGLSVLLVGLQLLGLVHLTLERHGVCWEHGTLTELDNRSVSAPPTAESAAPSGDLASNLSGLHRGGAARVEDADGDRHCPVQASRRNWATAPAPTELVLEVVPQLEVSAFTESSARSDDALLLRAPKQSPPPNA
jgi:hypothetical protein